MLLLCCFLSRRRSAAGGRGGSTAAGRPNLDTLQHSLLNVKLGCCACFSSRLGVSREVMWLLAAEEEAGRSDSSAPKERRPKGMSLLRAMVAELLLTTGWPLALHFTTKTSDVKSPP